MVFLVAEMPLLDGEVQREVESHQGYIQHFNWLLVGRPARALGELQDAVAIVDCPLLALDQVFLNVAAIYTNLHLSVLFCHRAWGSCWSTPLAYWRTCCIRCDAREFGKPACLPTARNCMLIRRLTQVVSRMYRCCSLRLRSPLTSSTWSCACETSAKRYPDFGEQELRS